MGAIVPSHEDWKVKRSNVTSQEGVCKKIGDRIKLHVEGQELNSKTLKCISSQDVI